MTNTFIYPWKAFPQIPLRCTHFLHVPAPSNVSFSGELDHSPCINNPPGLPLPFFHFIFVLILSPSKISYTCSHTAETQHYKAILLQLTKFKNPKRKISYVLGYTVSSPALGGKHPKGILFMALSQKQSWHSTNIE